MKKVGRYSVIPSSFTVARRAACSNLGCLGLHATETVLAKGKKKEKSVFQILSQGVNSSYSIHHF